MALYETLLLATQVTVGDRLKERVVDLHAKDN